MLETVTNVVDSLTDMNATGQRSSSTELGQAGTNCMEVPPTLRYFCDDRVSVFVSYTTRLLLQDVVYIGVIPWMTMVGCVVNVINIAVFVKQGLGDRVNLTLCSLSIADLLALTSLCIVHLDKVLAVIVSQHWVNEEWKIPLLRLTAWALPSGFQLVSMFISIVIAVDRCVCVTWPLRAARVLSTRVTGLVILVSSVIIIAGKQFVALKFDTRCAFMSGDEAFTFSIVVPSDLYRVIPTVMDALDSFVFSLLIPILSFLITAVATAITAITLKRASAWRDNSAGRTGTDVINQKERALTSMLIVISCIYLTCISPRVVEPICRFFFSEFTPFGRLCGLLLVVEAMTNVTLSINSTVNFFVYYKMGSRFRERVHKLLPCAVSVPSKKPTGT